MDIKDKMATTIEEYFGTLLQSVTEMHEAHLKTGKYSDHIALNKFYDKMPKLVDDLVEHYQGINGKVNEYKNNFHEVDFTTPVEYIEALREFVNAGRDEFCKESELSSDVDAILAQIDSTLYKLNELKESGTMKSLRDYLLESLN